MFPYVFPFYFEHTASASTTLTLRPNGAGDETNQTIGGDTPAGTNWESVDETVADDDTTYVYARPLRLRDLYNLPASSGSGAISKITVYAKVKVTDKAVCEVQISIKSGATTTDSALKSIAANDTWETVSQGWALNPDDSEAWEWADIDGLQIGTYLLGSMSEQASCTQVYVGVVVEAIPAPNRPDVIVRAAFGNNPFDTSPIWDDISSDVLEVHTQRGRKHELDRMQAGTCTLILDNTSGNYYPDNPNSPYFGELKTMKRFNIRASYGSDSAFPYTFPFDFAPEPVDVFTGYVESWTPAWRGQSGTGPIVKVVLSDALKIFGTYLLNNAGEAEELSGTRVGNVADEVSWPATWRDLDAGAATLQATGAQANINALSHLQTLQDSELGIVYIAPDGDLQFEDSAHRDSSPHDAALSIFGDSGEATGEDRYSGIDFVLDETLLYNDIRMTRIGGAEQTDSDTDSQALYGVRSLSRTGLLNVNDASTLTLAGIIAARYPISKTRVKAIVLQPQKNPGSLWYKALNYGTSDRINVKLLQASVDRDYFIEGIAHDWIANRKSFTTRWQLSDANPTSSSPSAVNEILLPNGAGITTNIQTQSPDSGAHWDKVTSNDADATYVRQTTDGAYDLYAIADSTYGGGVINSVTFYVYLRRAADNTGFSVSYARIKVYTHSTLYSYAYAGVPHTDYQVYSQTLTTNPNTSSAWTWDEMNDLQAGPFLDAQIDGFPQSSNAMHCTYFYVKVNFTPTL